MVIEYLSFVLSIALLDFLLDLGVYFFKVRHHLLHLYIQKTNTYEGFQVKFAHKQLISIELICVVLLLNQS